jgi:hypothetical protein
VLGIVDSLRGLGHPGLGLSRDGIWGSGCGIIVLVVKVQ